MANSHQNTFQWWQTGVIYQIYPRSYMDTTGNGIGDLQGVINKLDYLSDTLGVDALWLSPFFPSPMADFGYDVSDYVNVHPLFGDLAMFDRLVKEAHTRGLKVIIDIVPNHSSDQHAWFVESRSSRDNPKRDWYVWRDAKPDGSPPNNWLSVFGGPAWEWDEHTGQYYLHSFLKEQPDLDWRNPVVKEAMLDVFRFWLDRGVDGFRIDVAQRLMKDPLERDNPLNESGKLFSHKAMGEYDSQIHIYDVTHEDIHGVFREIRGILDAYSENQPRYSVGEIHEYDFEKWALYYGKELDELHMPFNFALLDADWDASAIRKVVDDLEAAIPEGAWPNYVLGNHDDQRMVTRIGALQARVAAMLLLTLRGTPTLYYGDELGMPESVIPDELVQDPWGISVPGLSRDGCRTPMQWNDQEHAGFSTSDSTWLPAQPDYASRNVAVQLGEQSSSLNLYRTLLAYRSESIALQVGRYVPLDKVPSSCYVYKRETEHESVLVVLNFSNESVNVIVPSSATLKVTTYLDKADLFIDDALQLRPHEGVILSL